MRTSDKEFLASMSTAKQININDIPRLIDTSLRLGRENDDLQEIIKTLNSTINALLEQSTQRKQALLELQERHKDVRYENIVVK